MSLRAALAKRLGLPTAASQDDIFRAAFKKMGAFDKTTDKRLAYIVKQAQEVRQAVREGRVVLERARQLFATGQIRDRFEGKRAIDAVMQPMRDLAKTAETTVSVGPSWAGGKSDAAEAISALESALHELQALNREIFDVRSNANR